MLAAWFAYQLVDLLLAAAVIAAVARRVDRGGRSLRRTALLTVPTAAGLLLLLAFLFAAWLHEPFGALAWALLGAKWSIRFLGVGAAAWGVLVLLPALTAWRAWRRPLRAAGARLVDPPPCGPIARGASLLWLAGALALFAEMALLAPGRVVVERRDVALPEWPPGAPPLRIAVLADLQSPRFGAREERVIGIVRELAPDLIVLPGDLVAQSLDDAAALDCARRVLRGVEAPLGSFAVNGDVDELVAGGIAEAVRDTPARWLDNAGVLLTHPVADAMAFELVGFDPTEPAGFARALAAPPRAAVRMALVHQPEHVTRLGPAGFDLVIAGHTHGGQIVLPGIGPLVTLSPLPDAIDAGGLHRHSGTQLVVSRGIGCEAGFAPPLRLFCSPEVTLVTVRGTAARSPVEEGAR